MANLQRFNGMISMMLYDKFGKLPIKVNFTNARARRGIKVPKGENIKLKVIEWVSEKYPELFQVEYTKHGNPKPGTDDKADAIIIALSHFD
jgi:hypothetical protein